MVKQIQEFTKRRDFPKEVKDNYIYLFRCRRQRNRDVSVPMLSVNVQYILFSFPPSSHFQILPHLFLTLYLCHLQPWCTPASLGMCQPSSSGCTRGRPATTPRCWESGSSSASTRSPTRSGRGWRSTSSTPGHTLTASTWTPWVLILMHPNPVCVHPVCSC